MSYVKNICIIAGLLCSTQVCNAEVAESQAERVCCIDWNQNPNNTLYAETSYSNIHDLNAKLKNYTYFLHSYDVYGGEAQPRAYGMRQG